MEQQNCLEEITESKDPLEGGEDLREEFSENSERSEPTETKDDAEARNDFWSIEGDVIYRHHVELRVPPAPSGAQSTYQGHPCLRARHRQIFESKFLRRTVRTTEEVRQDVGAPKN